MQSDFKATINNIPNRLFAVFNLIRVVLLP